MSDLVNESCNFKSWDTLKNEYHLDNKLYFQWIQLICAILLIWKEKINDSKKDVEPNYVVQDSLIKNTRVIVLHKLTTRELYSVLLLSSGNIPTSKNCYDKVFPNENFELKKNYILPRVTFNIIFNTKYFITYCI